MEKQRTAADSDAEPGFGELFNRGRDAGAGQIHAEWQYDDEPRVFRPSTAALTLSTRSRRRTDTWRCRRGERTREKVDDAFERACTRGRKRRNSSPCQPFRTTRQPHATSTSRRSRARRQVQGVLIWNGGEIYDGIPSRPRNRRAGQVRGRRARPAGPVRSQAEHAAEFVEPEITNASCGGERTSRLLRFEVSRSRRPKCLYFRGLTGRRRAGGHGDAALQGSSRRSVVVRRGEQSLARLCNRKSLIKLTN